MEEKLVHVKEAVHVLLYNTWSLGAEYKLSWYTLEGRRSRLSWLR